MDVLRVIINLTILLFVDAKIIKKDLPIVKEQLDDANKTDEVFNDIYIECFVTFSFPCVQRKTLMYLKQLNNLSEVSIIGDYVKFVRLNTSEKGVNNEGNPPNAESNSEELTRLIDQAIDNFFDNHMIKFSALGRDFTITNNVEEFVGRKKRKGGGGGGMMAAHDGGHFGHKKMMMMAMMCMKMKMMMMLPAMMGMMGMMSFKGMMFSMMSFMVSKMMLLMKILEKKGGLGGNSIGGGGGDGGWATGGSSGGAWMPAGVQDFGGGGGYDANGQWQSRSIFENKEMMDHSPIISYMEPVVTYSNPNKLKTYFNTYNNGVDKSKKLLDAKSRKKRSVLDVIQNSYMYWMNKLLGMNSNNRRTSNIPKFKYVNGIKYVFYPYPYRQNKVKAPKEIAINKVKNTVQESPIITADDFNKGEIMEGAVESRMMRKKLQKVKDNVNDTLDDNPWE